MNLDDLRYSNSLYVYRSVLDKPKTVEEIAEETEMTKLTVNKIVKELLTKRIFAKHRLTENKRAGRPNVYYGLDEFYFSTLMLSENGKLTVYYIKPKYKNSVIEINTYPINNENASLAASLIRGYIGKNNPKCLDAFLMGDNLASFTHIKYITKLELSELFIKAYADEEKTVLVEYDGESVLINHKKGRVITASRAEVEAIIDIDEYHDLRGKSRKDLIFIGIQGLTKKLIEEKI